MTTVKPWQDDTELSDLARDVAKGLDLPWHWVVTAVEAALERGNPFCVRTDVSKAYDEYGVVLGKKPKELDDKEKRVAVLKAMQKDCE